MQSLIVVMVQLLALGFGHCPADDDPKTKFADCPAPVQKAFQTEAPGSKIEFVTKEKDDESGTIYWTDTLVNGKNYSIGILEDGTLAEMNLTIDDEEVTLERCPMSVQLTFKSEAFGEKVAEDGTLVEKVLVIEDEEVELAKCPAAVQTALNKHAKGGTINEITRYTGIGKNTYEAEVDFKGKVYLIEVAESGTLLSKSLEAGEE
jgi:hypothetical protein